MSESEKEFRSALARIAEVANMALNGHAVGEDSDDNSEHARRKTIVCTPKSLPRRLWIPAAQTAVSINPVNAPAPGALSAVAMGLVLKPLHIAAVTSKYWGPASRKLPVSFVESTPSDLRKRIVGHMNAWTKSAAVQFVETNETGIIRISRGKGGYWSYLGTDVLHIHKTRPTMNLEGFTMATSESEFKRVVRHETGHTLAFPHEHMRRALVARIDPEKAYEYFLKTQGWDSSTVDEQVLTPLDEKSILSTPPDETSIMCYQLPGSITHDGQPIVGGKDVNESDYAFAGKIYPKPDHHESLEHGEEASYDEGEFLETALAF